MGWSSGKSCLIQLKNLQRKARAHALSCKLPGACLPLGGFKQRLGLLAETDRTCCAPVGCLKAGARTQASRCRNQMLREFNIILEAEAEMSVMMYKARRGKVLNRPFQSGRIDRDAVYSAEADVVRRRQRPAKSPAPAKARRRRRSEICTFRIALVITGVRCNSPRQPVPNKSRLESRSRCRSRIPVGGRMAQPRAFRG